MAQFAHDSILPDATSNLEKKDQVAGMFDNISRRYDFLNRFLSLGIDQGWRKKALKLLIDKNPKYILDVATGTADVAIMASKILNPTKIVGIDISNGMLKIGREKIKKHQLQNIIELQEGDSASIQFKDNTFDAVTVAFGVRNFQHLEKGMDEIKRVLKPGGKLIVLEFSRPALPVVKQLYNFYMLTICPTFGRLFSKNKQAYKYLDASIKKFPEGNSFLKILKDLGYKNSLSKKLTLGICSIYSAEK